MFAWMVIPSARRQLASTCEQTWIGGFDRLEVFTNKERERVPWAFGQRIRLLLVGRHETTTLRSSVTCSEVQQVRCNDVKKRVGGLSQGLVVAVRCSLEQEGKGTIFSFQIATLSRTRTRATRRLQCRSSLLRWNV